MAKSILTTILWNLAMAATVFLPVFIAGLLVTKTILGFPFAERGVAYEAGSAVIVYVGLIIPVVEGVLTHTAAFLLWRRVGNGSHVRIGALALAPLVPLTPLALGNPVGLLLWHALVATTVATLAYGIGASPRYFVGEMGDRGSPSFRSS